MNESFISQEDLADYFGREIDQARGVMAVDSACAMVRSSLNQQLDYVEDDEVALDSEGTETLLLPEIPVVEVLSLTSPGGIELTEGTDYVVNLHSGTLRTKTRGYRFLPGRQIYTVVYSHGFVFGDESGLNPDAPEWPADLRMLALTLAARIYDQQLVKQESVGGVQVIYASNESLGWSPREMNLLIKYGAGRKR